MVFDHLLSASNVKVNKLCHQQFSLVYIFAKITRSNAELQSSKSNFACIKVILASFGTMMFAFSFKLRYHYKTAISKTGSNAELKIVNIF